MHPISTAKLDSVTSLILEGYSCRDIAKKTGVGKSTVDRIMKKVESNKENISNGRPSKLSERNRRSITYQFDSGRMDNAMEATKFINSVISGHVSVDTVRRALKKEGMRAVVKAKKPYLKPAHRKARLAFAHKYRHWTIDDWSMVLWSDETKINRFGSDGQAWVWKRKGEPLSDRTTSPAVKHGEEASWYGGVWVAMVLGYFRRLKV
jgi:transposase